MGSVVVVARLWRFVLMVVVPRLWRSVLMVRSRSWCSMMVVRSHSWCSMLVVAVMVVVTVHDTTHLADHQNYCPPTSHPNVRTTPATLMPLET